MSLKLKILNTCKPWLIVPAAAITLKKSFWQRFLLLIAGALIVLLSFWPSLQGEFLNWDDDLHLTQNEQVLSLSLKNINNIFTTTINQTYIPLTIFSFAIEYKIWGMNPFVFHLNNLILHLLCVGLVVWLGGQLGLSFNAVLLSALLFAIHPMHVESVAWITERKDVLYSAFYLLSLNFYVLYVKKTSWFFWFGSLLAGLLSILAKPMALSLPLVLYLMDFILKRNGRVRVWLYEKAPFFLMVVPIAWLTYRLNIHWPAVLKWDEAILVWGWTAVFYIKKFFFPFFLLPLYSLPKPVSILTTSYLFHGLMLLMICASLYVFSHKRWFVFAIGYYFLSVFFLFRFDDLNDVHVVADRFMYLPSLGFCFWIGLILQQTANFYTQQAKDLLRKVFFFIVMTLLFLLAVKTNIQSRIWQNSLTLWNYVLEHNRQHPLPFNSRGAILLDSKKYKEALSDFNEAIQLRPDYAKAFYNRGQLFNRQKAYPLALTDFNKAIELDPRLDSAYSGRASVYFKQRLLKEALIDLDSTLKLNPHRYKDFNNRGLIYLLLNQPDQALTDLNTAIALKPDFKEAFLNRSKVYFKNNQLDLALKDIDQVLGMHPNWIPALEQQEQIDAQLANSFDQKMPMTRPRNQTRE